MHYVAWLIFLVYLCSALKWKALYYHIICTSLYIWSIFSLPHCSSYSNCSTFCAIRRGRGNPSLSFSGFRAADWMHWPRFSLATNIDVEWDFFWKCFGIISRLRCTLQGRMRRPTPQKHALIQWLCFLKRDTLWRPAVGSYNSCRNGFGAQGNRTEKGSRWGFERDPPCACISGLVQTTVAPATNGMKTSRTRISADAEGPESFDPGSRSHVLWIL